MGRRRLGNTLVKHLLTSKTEMRKTTLQTRIKVKDFRFKLQRRVISQTQWTFLNWKCSPPTSLTRRRTTTSPTPQEVTVSQGKSFLLDFEPLLIAGEKEEGASKVEPEEIDIDLTDPAVEAAATKIQSVFKGFRARKNLQQKSL